MRLPGMIARFRHDNTTKSLCESVFKMELYSLKDRDEQGSTAVSRGLVT